jgi:hypothetical protein
MVVSAKDTQSAGVGLAHETVRAVARLFAQFLGVLQRLGEKERVQVLC